MQNSSSIKKKLYGLCRLHLKELFLQCKQSVFTWALPIMKLKSNYIPYCGNAILLPFKKSVNGWGTMAHPHWLVLGNISWRRRRAACHQVALSGCQAPLANTRSSPAYAAGHFAFSLLPLHQSPFSTLLFSQMSSLTHLSMQLHAHNWWKTLVKLVGCKTAELGAGGKVRAEESSLRPPGAAMTVSHTLSNLSELASSLPGNVRSRLIAESCVGIV